MADLQELISRGRFIMSTAPKRMEVFNFINGKKSTKEIATNTNRSLSSVIQDIEKLRDLELVREKKIDGDKILKKDGATVYEKVPLIKHVPSSYFEPVADTTSLVKEKTSKTVSIKNHSITHIPSENEILEICKNHEDQLYEFKAPGVAADKITREIAGFLHTKNGGVVFYGIDDSGTVIGSDIRRHDLDQSVQNSVRNTLSPQPNIQVVERNVMGSSVLLVVVPPWDRKTIYQYTKDGNYYIRKGANIFALRPEELAKLHKGQYVV
ncbi:MAG: ATP-binding protein [Candidatus Nitrosotenuis sp.]